MTIGTAANPVFIIVDLGTAAALTIKNNVTINGILFVMGDWDNTDAGTGIGGTAFINGIIVVDGNLTHGEGLTITYDTNVLDNMSRVGIYTRLPGSWTDS